MNPFYLLETLNNNAFSLVSAWHGLRGANTSVSGWRTPGLTIVGAAARVVARREASAAVVYGAGRNGGPVVDDGARATAASSPTASSGAMRRPRSCSRALDDATARGASPIALVRGSATGSAGRGTLAAAVRATALAACAEAGVALAAMGTVQATTQATLEAVDAGARGPAAGARRSARRGPAATWPTSSSRRRRWRGACVRTARPRGRRRSSWPRASTGRSRRSSSGASAGGRAVVVRASRRERLRPLGLYGALNALAPWRR